MQTYKITNLDSNHTYPSTYSFDPTFEIYYSIIDLPLGIDTNPNVIFPELENLEIIEI